MNCKEADAAIQETFLGNPTSIASVHSVTGCPNARAGVKNSEKK